jgi:hypothetical protein
MTTTINITWYQPDERSLGREDSAWYTYQSAHDIVATVSNGDREIDIFADGEMRIHIEQDGDIVVVRYCDRLPENGINNDDELNVAVESGEAEFINNSWFDLYASDRNVGDQGWLDCVHHSLSEAIEQATALLSHDELWGGAE